MELLGEIIHDEKLDLSGQTLTRRAVRGIVLRDRELLMIYSPVNGDYKFPGGGVNEGESDDEALVREVREECGPEVDEIGEPYGKMLSYREAREENFDIFEMTSRYYRCSIHDRAFGEQQLDGYEKELEFQPVWVDIRDAIREKEPVLESSEPPRWTKRETFVLNHLNAHLDDDITIQKRGNHG